jgi:hypothetical protein
MRLPILFVPATLLTAASSPLVGSPQPRQLYLRHLPSPLLPILYLALPLVPHHHLLLLFRQGVEWRRIPPGTSLLMLWGSASVAGEFAADRAAAGRGESRVERM